MAKVLKELKLKYAWKELFLGEHGPKNHCTILVLLVICEHMDPNGSHCWPSQSYLARRTRLTDRAVRTHVALAVAAGWLSVRPKERVKGRSWFVNEYTPLIPESGKKTVWRKPGLKVPAWLRETNGADGRVTESPNETQRFKDIGRADHHPEPPSGSSADQEELDSGSSQTAQSGLDHPEPPSRSPGTVFPITRKEVPTTPSKTISVTTTGTGLPQNGFARGVVGDIKKHQKPEPESEASRVARIEALLPLPDYTDADIARVAHVTEQEVRHRRLLQ